MLKVISRSTFNLQTVLDTLVESAARLCGATHGLIFRFDGTAARAIAAFNYVPGFKEFWAENPILPNRGTTMGRAIVERRVVHIPDLLADAEYNPPEGAETSQKLGEYRTILVVPMLREGLPLGAITLWKTKVEPFTDKQIELVTTFADQAVIAMENARLLDELRQRTVDLTESLDQQTATSEVLQVISSSQGELEPVFQAMLENATRICEATFGSMLLYDGDAFRRVAIHNAPSPFAKFNETEPLIRTEGNPTLTRLVETKRPVHVADLAADSPDEPIARYAGARTLLVVPMLKEDELIGAIGIYRQESDLSPKSRSN